MKSQPTSFTTHDTGGYVDEIEVTSRLINMILDMTVSQQLDLLNRLDANGYLGARKQVRTALKNPWVVMVDPEEENASFTSYIRDISRCGMFIETERAFKTGESVVLTFQMPASRKLFKIAGEVVRFQGNGIGVKFKRQFAAN
jgi:Tfp pilus assembly protein PilZ